MCWALLSYRGVGLVNETFYQAISVLRNLSASVDLFVSADSIVNHFVDGRSFTESTLFVFGDRNWLRLGFLVTLPLVGLLCIF